LGTFLVRSGVLTSVHAFAVDPGRGLYILCFMVAVVGTSLLLFAWRAPSVGLGGWFGVVSRESLLLVNNVLFSAAALAVFTGTLYPLLLDVLGGAKISVGPPYFEAVFIPLVVPALVLMGVGPMARWKRSTLPELQGQLRWALGASGLSALLLGWLLKDSGDSANGGGWTPLGAFGLVLATWCVASAGVHAWQRLAGGEGGWRERAARQRWSWWGMLLAHAGVGLFVFGATLATGFETRRELSLAVGQTVDVAGYQFRLDRLDDAPGPNYDARRATVRVLREGHEIAVMQPEKRRFRAQAMPLSQAAIDTGPTRDLFVALGDEVDAHTWTVRLHVKPFMAWIWVGCLLMALGGLMALADRRYRTGVARQSQVSVPPGMPATAGRAR
jgi:cytochrome c-type biogenesis protein CcmF